VQRADYIEDGWYVLIEGATIKLMCIPYGGGEEEYVEEHDSLLEAIEAGKALT